MLREKHLYQSTRSDTARRGVANTILGRHIEDIETRVPPKPFEARCLNEFNLLLSISENFLQGIFSKYLLIGNYSRLYFVKRTYLTFI